MLKNKLDFMSNFKGIFVSLQHIRVYKDYLISTICRSGIDKEALDFVYKDYLISTICRWVRSYLKFRMSIRTI